jgi:hypothetical protein
MKVAAATVVAALALGVAGCGSEEESTTATQTPTGTTVTQSTDTASTEAGGTSPYPEAARQSFLDSCSAGAAPEMCECRLKYLEANVPLEEFVQAGLDIAEGKEPPVAVTRAKEECA